MAAGIGFRPGGPAPRGPDARHDVTENLAHGDARPLQQGRLSRSAPHRRRPRCRSIETLSASSRRTRAGRCGCCRAATSRRCCVGKWLHRAPGDPASSTSRRSASTSAPRPKSTRSCARERERGAAILVVSSDLEEVMTIADRIARHGCRAGWSPCTTADRSRMDDIWCARSAGGAA